MKLCPKISALEWKTNQLVLLDQTRLPQEETYLEIKKTSELTHEIKRLAVRGAPLLGIAGAYGCVLAAQEVLSFSHEERAQRLESLLTELENSRPTAVNLKWGIERQKKILASVNEISSQLVEAWIKEAAKIHTEDIESNRKIAQFGSEKIGKGNLLTICNTGDLATGGIGTAFGILSACYQSQKASHVFACETRPLLQGLRLTAWELSKNQIPHTLICDNMAAVVLRDQNIAAVVTGADRITANGDAANKIGTYQLAVLAKHHGVPFIVAAPTSTFDSQLKQGSEIVIEERKKEEILGILGPRELKTPIPVWNPAFDVTPHSLISMIVCEFGVIENPTESRMKDFLKRDG